MGGINYSQGVCLDKSRGKTYNRGQSVVLAGGLNANLQDFEI